MTDAPAPGNNTLYITISSLVRWIVGVPLFIISTLIVIVATFFLTPFQLDKYLHHYTRLVVLLAGIRIRTHGLEQLDPKKTYLFVFNHVNQFDHFVIYSAMPFLIRGIEHEKHFRWPLYGQLLRRIGQISIPPRGNTSRAIASLDNAKAAMERGISVAMAPEGTRSRTGELQSFKKGAFHLAIDSKFPLVPLILVGAYAINRKGEWRIRPGTIDIYVEPPIDTSNLAPSDVTPLLQRVREIFLARLGENA